MELEMLEAGRSGEWVPVEELRESALTALAEGKDVTVNLSTIDYLDASALQILMALAVEQKKAGRRLNLANVSPSLQQWFDYSGATGSLFHDMPGEQ
jgi:anti-anti-sigma factor